jgi:hypothetical protein
VRKNELVYIERQDSRIRTLAMGAGYWEVTDYIVFQDCGERLWRLPNEDRSHRRAGFEGMRTSSQKWAGRAWEVIVKEKEYSGFSCAIYGPRSLPITA